MPTIKDLILSINETVNSNELSTLAGASGLGEVEVTDDGLKEVKTKLGSLLSIDAAKNNHDLEDHFKKKLHPTIKGELLGNIDTDLLSNAKDLFGEESVNEFKELEFTGDKLKKFTELTKSLIAKSSTDDKLKEVNDGLRNQLTELSNNHQKELKKKEKEVEKLNQGFADTLIRKEFNGMLSNYKLGEKYQEGFVKKALFDDVYSKVSQKAKLTLNEDMSKIIPRNPEKPDLELFINNKKVEDLKELLDPVMEPYIQKSGNDGPPSTYKRVEPGKVSSLGADFRKRKEQANNV